MQQDGSVPDLHQRSGAGGQHLQGVGGEPWLAAPGAGGELLAIQAELEAHPALVVLDPLYLAAAGASGSNLYDMGAVLQAIQGACHQAGCALLVVTHWNKTGDGRGADRISGAGPAAWARVICSISIQYRGSDPDGASSVVLGVELIGGEIADTRFRIRRRSALTTRPTSARHCPTRSRS